MLSQRSSRKSTLGSYWSSMFWRLLELSPCGGKCVNLAGKLRNGSFLLSQIQGSKVQLAECEGHRNPQWKRTSNHSRKCSNSWAEAPRQSEKEDEANMTLEELIRWRRQEERLIHGEDPDFVEERRLRWGRMFRGAGCPAGVGRPARAVWPARAGRSAAARARVPIRRWWYNSRRSLPEHDGRGARCVAKSRRSVLRVRLRRSGLWLRRRPVGRPHQNTCHSKEGGNIPWVKAHV